jgi:predicted RNA-binding protein YlqC (UPF0109 family)
VKLYRRRTMIETKDLVYEIVKKLVDSPEEVKVTEVTSDTTNVLELKVAPNDIGKIIGKKGKTVKAIRNIISAASAKINKRSIVEIKE